MNTSGGLVSGKQGLSGGAGLGAVAGVALMPVGEVEEAVEVGLELSHRGEVVAPEGDPPLLPQDGALESFDEAVGPGVARLDPCLTDAVSGTGLSERSLVLAAAVGQHPLQRQALLVNTQVVSRPW